MSNVSCATLRRRNVEWQVMLRFPRGLLKWTTDCECCAVQRTTSTDESVRAIRRISNNYDDATAVSSYTCHQQLNHRGAVGRLHFSQQDDLVSVGAHCIIFVVGPCFSIIIPDPRRLNARHTVQPVGQRRDCSPARDSTITMRPS